MFRIGFGTDIHRLVADRPLIIGGVSVESELGSDGHSDGDVLFHSLTDALLGAIAAGDIGLHFPNSDEHWRDASSDVFLRFAAEMVRERGFEIANVDATIDLERPKLRQYIDTIRHRTAEILAIEIDQVSVKAKTGEAVDSVGEGRSIRCQSVVLIERIVSE